MMATSHSPFSIRRIILGTLTLVCPIATASASKRGLIFIPNKDHPEDNQKWVEPKSSLTWYYNYEMTPSASFADISQDEFEFVPMLWGTPSAGDETEFFHTVRNLINDGGRNITHVCGFNEPDAPGDWGGSDMDPKTAAKAWTNNMEPLKKEFPWLRLGLPACTAIPGWVDWLGEFMDECARIEHDGRKNCTFDFLPLHWYDNFGGLASHMGTAREFFPDVPLWITEYAYAHQDLGATQDFYKQSAEYFDRLDFVERYSYFGAFRSDVSNVGPNAAFLNTVGKLTDIGSWYLGRDGTGVVPQSIGVMDRPGQWGMLGCLILVVGVMG